MSPPNHPEPTRCRFADAAAPPHDAAHERFVLRLLLAQDGSTTRLCEAIAGMPVQLHLLSQRITQGAPASVREALPGTSFIERVTCLAAHGEVMMDNLSYIALQGLDAGARAELEAGRTPIGHLLARRWVRRSALPAGDELLPMLWRHVGLPDADASRHYRVEGTAGPMMVIAETFRRGMLFGFDTPRRRDRS